ncbi:MAG TPA: RDD family protein [Acidimicrobiales bacterium]|nr:RDD family protein [Acidimicrobiales bacterium]
MDDQGDDWGDTLAGFDIGDLSPNQRQTLSTDLADAGILHAFVGPKLQGPAAESELIEHLVAQTRRGGRGSRRRTSPGAAPGSTARPGTTGPLPRALRLPWGAVPLEVVGLPIAAPWRRFAAYLVEAIAFNIAIALVLVYSVGGAELFSAAVGLTSALVLVAAFGGTLGMMVFRMRVVAVDAPDRTAPGWRVAVVRYLVAWWPQTLVMVADPFVDFEGWRWVGTLMQIWLVVCFTPILLDPARRGLHDRVAGTVVIDAFRGPFSAPSASRGATR